MLYLRFYVFIFLMAPQGLVSSEFGNSHFCQDCLGASNATCFIAFFTVDF